MISKDPREDGSHPVIYGSKKMPRYETAEEYGISDDMISHAFTASDKLSDLELFYAYSQIKIDGNDYEILLRELDSEIFDGAIVAYLTPNYDIKAQIAKQILLIVGVFAVIGAVFLVWIISVYKYVQEYRLDDRKFPVQHRIKHGMAVLEAAGVGLEKFCRHQPAPDQLQRCRKIQRRFGE